jgi:hypothetical protein
MRVALLTAVTALALAAPPGDDAVTASAPIWPRFSIRARTLHADRLGRVAVPVACPSRTPAPRGCPGRLSLLSGARVLARTRFELPRGAKATLRLRLGPATRARLARVGRLRAVLEARVEDLVPRRVTVTVVAPRQPKR